MYGACLVGELMFGFDLIYLYHAPTGRRLSDCAQNVAATNTPIGRWVVCQDLTPIHALEVVKFCLVQNECLHGVTHRSFLHMHVQ
jgi:hypothetical protein